MAAHRHGLLAGIVALVVFVSFALAITASSTTSSVGASAPTTQLTAGDGTAGDAQITVVRGRFDQERSDHAGFGGGGRGDVR